MIPSFRFSFLGALLVPTVMAFGQGCSSDSNDSVSSSKVSAITFDSNACSFSSVGETKQFRATASLPDGTKKDITEDSSATWNSADTQTVTVSKGLVTAVKTGITDVQVTYQGASNSINCKVL